MQKLLVTGGHGTLGSYISSVFNPAHISSPAKSEMPIEKKHAVSDYFSKIRPTAVIHLAALTDVDYCEKYPKTAFEVNVQGTQNLVSLCKTHAIPIVYVSSAAVFDGKKQYNDENDNPHPLNIYGETKYKSEQIIQKSGIEHIIVRIGWLIGGGKKEKKFISYILKLLQSKKDVRAVSDIYGTLIYAPDVLESIKEALDKSRRGIYHLGYKGAPSRYEIALLLKELLHSTSSVLPVPADAFRQSFPAPRPKREVLTSVKIPFSNHWEERLKQYVYTELL